MGDLDQKDSSGAVKLVGSDAVGNETEFAQVDLIDGVRRLQTSGLVKIEELFGQDNAADTWFYLGTPNDLGPIAVGDTVRVQIGVGPEATLFPAIDLTYTVVAGDVAAANPEIEVSKNIVTTLNSNVTFKKLWKASRIKGNSTVWIGSKEVAEWSERPNPGDFVVTSTGTITVLAAFNKIVRRGKSTSLAKDPADPRFGVLGITGTVAQGTGSLGELHFEQPSLDALGVDFNMGVDGDPTPQEFILPARVGFDLFIQELRFFGSGNGIKFGQFLSKNSVITNGILIEITSDGSVVTLPTIHSTEDFKNKFAVSGQWILEVQPGSDQFLATFQPSSPFPIKALGTFSPGVDDSLKITVRDDISAIGGLEMMAFGFLVEP